MELKAVRTVVLCAGRATRMGFDKLAEPFAGVPLARRLALALAELEPVVVATPAVAEVLRGIPGVRVAMTVPTAGPSATLHLAHGEVRPDEWLAVLAGDLPFMSAGHVRRFVERVPAGIDLAWPVVGGSPGHPVVWSPNARARIPALGPDEPPSRVREDPRELRCLALDETDRAYIEDVDTPEAWEAAQARALS